MIQQRVHVSVAIEGTTSTAYLTELSKLYGADHVLIYQLPRKQFIRYSDLQNNPVQSLLKLGRGLLENTPLLNTNQVETENIESGTIWFSKKQLPEDTAAVHGYFTPSLLKGKLENPFVSIILRDPLERMIAAYQEWKKNKGSKHWRNDIPYEKDLNFQDFSRISENHNFQSRCLGSQRLGDYDLVGVYECLAGFIAQLNNEDWTEYSKRPPAEPRIKKPRYKNLGITEEFLEEFKELHQKDYAIYQQAKSFMGYC
jgi:hypothetical protein